MKYLIATFIIVFSVSQAFAGTARIAVAANFLGSVKSIVKAFSLTTGDKAIVSAGSTGQLYSQIINGAPYDVFLSADKRRPRLLEKSGFIAKGSRFTYAIGRLALYSTKKGFVDDSGNVLKKGKFEHLAMADPKTAPYGLAAMETLEKLGLYKKLRPKIVQGISVSQTFWFVSSGSARLGFVALSQVRGAKKSGGSYWVVPDLMHSPIEQDGGLLEKGEGNKAAEGFIEFLKGDVAKKIIENFGYVTP